LLVEDWEKPVFKMNYKIIKDEREISERSYAVKGVIRKKGKLARLWIYLKGWRKVK
jgi:hypothetical protein